MLLPLLQVLGSESALVDDITTPGGVRALPDPKDLRRFVDTASSMDGLTIAELLREKMVRGCAVVPEQGGWEGGGIDTCGKYGLKVSWVKVQGLENCKMTQFTDYNAWIYVV